MRRAKSVRKVKILNRVLVCILACIVVFGSSISAQAQEVNESNIEGSLNLLSMDSGLDTANSTTSGDLKSIITDFDPTAIETKNTVDGITFTNPGIYVNVQNLELMQKMVRMGQDPWASAFDKFRSALRASKDYEPQNAKADITYFDAGTGAKPVRADADAAYAQVIMWYVTGDDVYRNKALQIIRLWGESLSDTDFATKEPGGNGVGGYGWSADIISTGIAISKFAFTADLLRCTPGSGWTDDDTTDFKHLLDITFPIYDRVDKYLNQTGYTIMALQSSAIFKNDAGMYRAAIDRATVNSQESSPWVDSSIKNLFRYVDKYYDSNTGTMVDVPEPIVVIAEMGRDQPHSNCDVAIMSTISQTARIQGTLANEDGKIVYKSVGENGEIQYLYDDYKTDFSNGMLQRYVQGDDIPAGKSVGDVKVAIAEDGYGKVSTTEGKNLFQFLNNRILKGINFFSKYNLGYEVPWYPVRNDYTNVADGETGATYWITPGGGRPCYGLEGIAYYYYKYQMGYKDTDEDFKYIAQAFNATGVTNASQDFFSQADLLLAPEEAKFGEPKGAPKELAGNSYKSNTAEFDRTQVSDRTGDYTPIGIFDNYEDEFGTRLMSSGWKFGEFLYFKDYDFGTEPVDTLILSSASGSANGSRMQMVLLDNVNIADWNNVTPEELGKGELVKEFQSGGTGWWTSFQTHSYPLGRELSGKHSFALVTYESNNVYKLTANMDWFCFANSYAFEENGIGKATYLSEGISPNGDGSYTMNSGSSFAFDHMDMDRGNTGLKINAAAAGDGIINIYSGDCQGGSFANRQLVARYKLKSNNNVMGPMYLLPEAGSKELKGVNDISFEYVGDTPLNISSIQLYVYSKEAAIPDLQAEAYETLRQGGSADRQTEQGISYVHFQQGSTVVYFRCATSAKKISLRVRTNSTAVVSFRNNYGNNGMNEVSPFLTINLPDTQGEWATIEYDLEAAGIALSGTLYVTVEGGNADIDYFRYNADTAAPRVDGFSFNPPVITSANKDGNGIYTDYIIKGNLYNAILDLFDKDGDNLNIRVIGLDDAVTNGNSFSWTPATSGTYNYSVYVNDGTYITQAVRNVKVFDDMASLISYFKLSPEGYTAGSYYLYTNEMTRITSEIVKPGADIVKLAAEISDAEKLLVRKPLSIYSFEGNSNNTYGASPATVIGTHVYSTGKVGQAISLNGTDSYLKLAANSTLSSYNEITLASWVYWTGSVTWQRIFDFGSDTNHYMFLSPKASGSKLRFAIKNGGTEQYVDASTGALASNTWVHVAVTIGNGTATLYVNGSVAGTLATTIKPSDFAPSLNYIGKSQFNDPLFSGMIDEFSIYNRALSSTEIKSVYNNTFNWVDNSKLMVLLDEAYGVVTSNYSAETAAAFQTAYDNAKTVASNSSATQTQVDSACDSLINAMNGLVCPVGMPIIDVIDGKSIVAQNPLSFNVEVANAPSDVVYGVTDLPDGASFNAATHTFDWTPAKEQGGVYTVTFTATSNGMTFARKVKITVKGQASITSSSSVQATAKQTITYNLTATDPIGSPLAYSAANLPSGASFNTVTGVFTWTPGQANYGSNPVTFTASNGSFSVSQTVDFKVKLNVLAPDTYTKGSYYLYSKEVARIETEMNKPGADKTQLAAQLTQAEGQLVSASTLPAEKISITQPMVNASSISWDGKLSANANAWCAFDGNTTTSPDTKTNPGWILVDLGAGNEQMVGSIKFIPRPSFASRMNGALIQGSNDGTNFDTLFTINGVTQVIWYNQAISSSKAYRYLRYYSSTGNANVGELQYYKKAIDKTLLTLLLSNAAAVTDNQCTADSYAALQTAVTSASSVVANANATQADIDAASSSLDTALNGLVYLVTASVDPVVPNGLNGWYTVPATVTLSTYGKAQYSVNGESTWHDYTSPITFDQDGVYTLSYKTTIMTTAQTITVNIDRTAPADVTFSADATAWTNSDVTVTINYPNDAAVKEYKVGDNGAWTAYTAPVVVSDNTTMYARGTDAAGNVSNVTSYTINKIDKITPVTKAEITPAQPDGAISCYVHPVTVALNATDDASGVVKIEYQVNGGEWTTYSGSIPAFGDGIYQVSYRSIDAAGNVEAAKTISFNLDTAAPVITVTGFGNGQLSDAMDIVPTVTISDNMSGVDNGKTQLTLDGKPYQIGNTIELYKLPLGTHTFVVSTSDLAGNTTSNTVTFTTFASIDGMKQLVLRFESYNWIDNAGITDSLMTKLQNNQVKAFLQEVVAQTGKHINDEAAAYLLRDDQALLP